MFRELPDIDTILMNPGGAPVPEIAAAQYAVASALARCASDTNFDRISAHTSTDFQPNFVSFVRVTPPCATRLSAQLPAM